MVRECALNGITLKYQGTRVSFDIETHYFESDSDFIPNVTSKNQIFRLIPEAIKTFHSRQRF